MSAAMKAALVFALISIVVPIASSQNSDVSLKQCWNDYLNIPCPDIQITHLDWIVRPPQDTAVGETMKVSWLVSASAEYSKNPYITHTNVHICPASFGSCPPPFKNPMRVDSVVIGGIPGIFNDTVTFKQGKWIVMLHSVLTDRSLLNNASNTSKAPKASIVMTQSIIRSVGDTASVVSNAWVDPKRAETEALVDLGYTASMVGLSLICSVGLGLWIRQRLPKHMKASSHHSPPESVLDYANSKRFAIISSTFDLIATTISILIATVVLYWSAYMIGLSIDSYLFPSRATGSAVASSLSPPNMLVCPMTPLATPRNLTQSFYPNIYALQTSPIPFDFFTLSITDSASGADLIRSCIKYKPDPALSISSEFATFFITVLIDDKSRAGNFGDALIAFYQEEEELFNPQILAANSIFIGRGRATFVGMKLQTFESLMGNVTKSYALTFNQLENPYASSTSSNFEIAVLVSFRTLTYDVVKEIWTYNWQVVISLILGSVSFAKLVISASTHIMEKLETGKKTSFFVFGFGRCGVVGPEPLKFKEVPVSVPAHPFKPENQRDPFNLP
jgi:hypothetical protein